MELLTQFVDIVLHLDKHLVVLVQQYGLWIYGILFVIVFSETGFVVTPFLPGDSLLFVAGALAALGEGGMDILVLIGVLTMAAILGNTVNYHIGRFLGPKVFHWENSRFFNRDALVKTHAFYEKHGGKTLVISRFLPIFRTFAPFVAGIGSMSYAKFTLFNLLGALGWVVSLCLAGYWLGNMPWVKANLSVIIVGIIVFSLVPIAIGYAQGPGGLMRWLVVLLALMVAGGCATKMGKDGRTESTVDVKYLAKTEVDRIADTVRSDVTDGLLLIADKLYKRNPREWKKAGCQPRGRTGAAENAPLQELSRTRRGARGASGGARLQRNLTKATACRH